ncbi:hypothetical protein LTS18_011650 [Coniosporium uncinatum]|uniref:Uncharacterized protein n=1 Tax=Coniosporium uncinatum TaxID=93489 RepID=A0ACC3CYD2_9PEZI|nr:hypothetical protein LTS18_011650 [Coniosporium uncinatum]
MAVKRTRDDNESRDSKKQKKGFSVGPANLPDGTHRRKVQKIKKDLIHKAKVKKEFAKIKQREQEADPYSKPSPYAAATENPVIAETTLPEPTTQPHPDRQHLMDTSASPEPTVPEPREPQQWSRRPKRAKPAPFSKEAARAQKAREEAEARSRVREEADRQRQEKFEERERFRRAMAKARDPRTGQRKLGRESKVLLEKVRRVVGEGR